MSLFSRCFSLFFLLFFTLVLSLDSYAQSCVGKRNFSRATTKVINGDPVRVKHWPGLVTLRLHNAQLSENRYQCGGTLIGDGWVLTAAHCFDYLNEVSEGRYEDAGGSWLQVVKGTDNLKDVALEDVSEIKKVEFHPNYKRYEAATKGHDIALVKLKTSWSYSRLPLGSNVDLKDLTQDVRVAGYGVTNISTMVQDPLRQYIDVKGRKFWAGSDSLQEAVVPLVPQNICKKNYKEFQVGEGQICGGLEEGGKDACQGDSGGPLVGYDKHGCPFQIGIVSWGIGCAEAGHYGVYTRVGHYAKWINKFVPNVRSFAFAKRTEAEKVENRFQFFERVKTQLESLLVDHKADLSLRITGGVVKRIGDETAFEVSSSIPGRLIIVDINADGQATQIFPNKFVSEEVLWNVKANETIRVPNEAQYGLRAFGATEPVGKGKLFALIVPQDFKLWATKAGQSVRTKGFQPLAKQTNFLQGLIGRISRYIEKRKLARGLSYEGQGAASEAPRWGMAVVDYEIKR